MDTSFGAAAKKLRLSKNISVKELASSVISYSQLLKFEKGDTIISADKLDYYLNFINVSAEEFERTRYHLINKTDFVFNQQVEEAFWTKNVAKLRHLLREEQEMMLSEPDNSRYFMNVIEIKAALYNVDRQYKPSECDIEDLAEYLLNIKEWSKYEIWLFSNCMGLFSNPSWDSTLRKLINKMLNPELHHIEPCINQSRINIALMNAISIFIENKHYDPISDYFSYLDKNISSAINVYERANLTYLRALLDFLQDNLNEKKLEKVEKCISAFEVLECFDLVNLLTAEVNQYKKQG